MRVQALAAAFTLLSMSASMSVVAQDVRLIEDFENAGLWRANNQTKLKSVGMYVRSGSSSLRLAGPGGQWLGAQRTYDSGFNLSNMKSVEFWVFVQSSNPDFVGSYVPFAVTLSSRRDFSSGFINRTPTTNLRVGWNKVTLSKNDFAQAKNQADSWNRSMVGLKLWLAPIPDGKVVAFFDKMTINYGRPVVIFTFDDCLASTYSRAYPVLQAYGMKGVSYIIRNRVAQPGYMAVDQLNELYTEGWDIANHSDTHVFMDKSNYDQAYSEIKNCNDFLVQQGWTENGRNLHFCCPGGRYNAAVLQAMDDLGLKTARCSIAGIQPQEVDNFHLLRSFYVGSEQAQPTTTLDFIDRAVMANGVAVLMFHDITEADPDRGSSNSLAAFTSIVQYVASLRNQGAVDVMTINEWYESVAKRS